MRTEKASKDEVVLPALLRAARATYAKAIRERIEEAGFDDIPRDGIFVIAAMNRTGAPLSHIIAWLGASKQAAGQLVDTLVLRGYLERSVLEEDRRRLQLRLTDRGKMVASLTRAVVDRVDARLLASVGAEYVAHTRHTLMALIDQVSVSAGS